MSCVSVVVGVYALVLSSQYARDVHLQEALTRRGVQASAIVKSSRYDPSGGDPGGWTSDVVSFADRDGKSFVAKVGHHGANTEVSPGKIEVIYDPTDPNRVKALEDYAQSSASPVMLTLAYIGAAAIAVIGCIGLLIWFARSGLRWWR